MASVEMAAEGFPVIGLSLPGGPRKSAGKACRCMSIIGPLDLEKSSLLENNVREKIIRNPDMNKIRDIGSIGERLSIGWIEKRKTS